MGRKTHSVWAVLLLSSMPARAQQAAPAQPKASESPPAVAVAAATPTSPAGMPAADEIKLPANLQQLRPNPLQYRIERKAFGPNKFFKRVEFFWVPSKAKPKAYVVLATNLAKPRLPLEDRQWFDFAEKNQLGLMSVGFDENSLEGLGRLVETAADLEGRVYNLAAEAFGTGLKGAFFGSGKGGYWLHRVVMRKPWLWGFWCSRDVDYYPQVYRGIEHPPGLILNTLPARYDDSLFFFQELRRAKATNKVGFVAMDGKSLDPAYLERFARHYLEAVFTGGNEAHLWLNVHTKENCALAEKPPPAVVQNWVPGDEAPGAWRLLHQERKRLPDSQVAFADARLLDGKLLKMIYRVPGRVRAGVAVRQVMICILWAENDEELQKKVQGSLDYKAGLWNRERIGVIAINARSFGLATDLPAAKTAAELKDLRQLMSIYSPAIWKVIGKANAELGWPTTQFHLFGSGIGASVAQALAYVDPSKFLTVQLNGGGPYLGVEPGMDKTCWLLSTGGKSAGYEATVKFYADAKKAGWPVTFNSRQGGAGTPDDWVWASSASFCGYTRDLADLLRKEQLDGKPASAPSVPALLLKNLRESPYVMDFEARKVVALADASQILDEKRISFPTTLIEEAWRVEGAYKPAVPGSSGATGAAAAPASPTGNGAKPQPVAPKPDGAAPAAAPQKP